MAWFVKYKDQIIAGPFSCQSDARHAKDAKQKETRLFSLDFSLVEM